MKKFSVFLVIISVLLAGVWGWVGFFLNHRSPETVIVYFESGASLRRISRELKREKVVSSAFLFEWYSRILGSGKSLKSGEYEFAEDSKAGDIFRMMVEGRVKFYPLTIPEGLTINETGRILISRNITNEAEWRLLVRDSKLIASLGISADTLEGYLFPDTYFVERRSTAADLAKNMAVLFKKKVSHDMLMRAEGMGLTLHQWVTLASIVEKETAVAGERPVVAAVFLNRLKKNMPLQTDPSVIYGIPDFDGNLKKSDLSRDTPYNTYLHTGLPPGPVCSPGLDSLRAVLQPAQNDFLYFVSKGDGTHHFSKTIGEHIKAVDYYQLHRGLPPM